MKTQKAVETGLSPQTVDHINRIFARYPEIEKAILYGSRAKGDFRKGSDIDFALIAPELTLTQLNKIDNELDDLLLPYKIDISALHKIENEDLLEHIKRVGKVFYEKQ